MIINREDHWAYIPTPKCASRSMVKVLKEKFDGVSVGNGHDNRVNQYIDAKKYNVWTIVRSPYSRVLSLWWRTCVQTGGDDDPYNVVEQIGTRGPEPECFTKFLEWMTAHAPSEYKFGAENPYNIMFQPQWYYLKNIDLNWIKLESLSDEINKLNFVPKEYDLDTKRNMSFDKPEITDDSIKGQQIQIINAYCQKSFDRFNYEMINHD